MIDAVPQEVTASFFGGKMQNNENFKLLSNLEKTINYINKELLNYPRYDVVLRNNIESTMYNLVELIHSYRITTNNRIKEKNLNDFIIKLSMLDYYMRVSYEKKIINSHKLTVITNYLIEIRKIVYGVIRSEKTKL